MFGTSPAFPDAGFVPCLAAAFHFPYGLYGLGLCIGALALLILMVMRMGYSEGGEYDRRRNLVYSNKGTYGTAGFMSRKELAGVLDLVPDIRKHSGTILGELDHQVICIPPKTRFNGNLAVYGASGSKKTRAFCVNMILQCAARKSSLVICDPKSELYEKTSEYLRDQGYTVRVFNLVTPSASDSWNCLAEVGGQELMAQLFCDVIIKNTGGEERDHFWDSAEMNLLKGAGPLCFHQLSQEKAKYRRGVSVDCRQLRTGVERAFWCSSGYASCQSAIQHFQAGVRGGARRRYHWARLQTAGFPKPRYSQTSHPTTRLIWNFRESSRARITALPAIRTAPLISSPRCFFPLCLSAWFAMRTNIVPAGSFRFLFMYLVKSCVPVE